MTEKRATITEPIATIDLVDDGALSLTSLIGLLMDAANRIPVELRETARAQVDVCYSGSSIDVTYERPETDEEQAKRLHNAAQWESYQEKLEMDQYLRLKAIYEGKIG